MILLNSELYTVITLKIDKKLNKKILHNKLHKLSL